MVKLLRSKYCYPNVSSIASSSRSCSWLWQGIMRTLPVLSKGLIFSVEEVLAINCWQDPWIPSLEGFKPSYRGDVESFIPTLQVRSLLLPNSLEWDEVFIREICDEESADAILCLPPP